MYTVFFPLVQLYVRVIKVNHIMAQILLKSVWVNSPMIRGDYHGYEGTVRDMPGYL